MSLKCTLKNEIQLHLFRTHSSDVTSWRRWRAPRSANPPRCELDVRHIEWGIVSSAGQDGRRKRVRPDDAELLPTGPSAERGPQEKERLGDQEPQVHPEVFQAAHFLLALQGLHLVSLFCSIPILRSKAQEISIALCRVLTAAAAFSRLLAAVLFLLFIFVLQWNNE